MAYFPGLGFARKPLNPLEGLVISQPDSRDYQLMIERQTNSGDWAIIGDYDSPLIIDLGKNILSQFAFMTQKIITWPTLKYAQSISMNRDYSYPLHLTIQDVQVIGSAYKKGKTNRHPFLRDIYPLCDLPLSSTLWEEMTSPCWKKTANDIEEWVKTHQESLSLSTCLWKHGDFTRHGSCESGHERMAANLDFLSKTRDLSPLYRISLVKETLFEKKAF